MDFPPLVTGTEELGDGSDDVMTRAVLREAVSCLPLDAVGGVVVVVVVSGLQSPVVDPLLPGAVKSLFDPPEAVSPGCILHSKIITSIEV